MVNLGATLWGFKKGKTASIRARRIHYVARCESRTHCGRYARIQIECREGIGHPFWNRDYCDAHAQSVLKRAGARGVPVSWF
jgi:hypothetical protein